MSTVRALGARSDAYIIGPRGASDSASSCRISTSVRSEIFRTSASKLGAWHRSPRRADRAYRARVGRSRGRTGIGSMALASVARERGRIALVCLSVGYCIDGFSPTSDDRDRNWRALCASPSFSFALWDESAEHYKTMQPRPVVPCIQLPPA